MLEADGSMRIVDYTADDKHGFNAIVKHEGVAHHPHNYAKHQQKPKPESNIKTYSSSSLTLTDSYGNHIAHNADESESKKYEYPATLPQNHKEDSKQEFQYQTVKYAPNYVQTEPVKYVAAAEYKPENDQADLRDDEESHGVRSNDLPVDLDYVKPEENFKHVPVDVSVIKPIELDLTSVPDFNQDITLQHQQHHHEAAGPPKELSDEEVNEYLKEYYKNHQQEESEPSTTVAGFIPNTFKTGKRPATTPGLLNYASSSDINETESYNYDPHLHGGQLEYPTRQYQQEHQQQHQQQNHQHRHQFGFQPIRIVKHPYANQHRQNQHHQHFFRNGGGGPVLFPNGNEQHHKTRLYRNAPHRPLRVLKTRIASRA